MADSTTGSVYVQVIDDVISKVRQEFVNNGGPGEGVLNELQRIWQLKMMHSVTAQTPLPGTSDNSYNIPTGGGTRITRNDYPLMNENGFHGIKTERPSSYMQPPSPWLHQMTPVDVNLAYVEACQEVERGANRKPVTHDFFHMSAGKRKLEEFPPQYSPYGYIPQQDGAGDVISSKFEFGQCSNSQHGITTSGKLELMHGQRLYSWIRQLDGLVSDPYDGALSTPNAYNYQGVVNDDYKLVNTPASDLQAATPAIVTHNHGIDDDDDDDDDDESLNENDDDDDLGDVEQEEDVNTQNLVLAQFDKVTNTKSRWKCTLKDGIMHINNKDILFNKATGVFDF